MAPMSQVYIPPVSIVFDLLDFKQWRVFPPLVSCLYPSYATKEITLEGQVVVFLRFGSNIADRNVDGLSGICSLQVDRPDQVHVLEDLRWSEGTGEDLCRRQGGAIAVCERSARKQ